MIKKIKPIKPSGKQCSSQQLQMALMHIFDMFDAAHVQFVVLGDLAKCLHDKSIEVFDPDLKADKVIIGVKEGELSEYAISTMKSFYSDELKKEDYGWSMSFENVPIQIKVIKKKFKFMERPDVRTLATEGFNIPNPFESYWKARYFI